VRTPHWTYRLVLFELRHGHAIDCALAFLVGIAVGSLICWALL